MFRAHKIEKTTTNLPSCNTGKSDGHTHPGAHANVQATISFTLLQVVMHADPQSLYTKLLGQVGTMVVPVVVPVVVVVVVVAPK